MALSHLHSPCLPIESWWSRTSARHHSCRDRTGVFLTTWEWAVNVYHPKAHILMVKISIFSSLILLLLHTQDDMSPRRLTHYLSLPVNHPSSQRADKLSFGLFNPVKIPANITLVLPNCFTEIPSTHSASKPSKSVSYPFFFVITHDWIWWNNSFWVWHCIIASCLEMYLLRNGLRKDQNSPGSPQLV